MAREHQLDVLTRNEDIVRAVGEIKNNTDRPIVTQTNTLEEFAEAVFDDIDPHRLYIATVTRPRDGIGAHFDVYDDLLDPEAPFVAAYNRAGAATLRAVELNAALDSYYRDVYPRKTTAARAARRPLGTLALERPGAVVHTADIREGTGLVIPQVKDALPLVHEIVPTRSPRHRVRVPGAVPNGGTFVKLSVPKDTKRARKELRQEHYIPMSDYQARQEVAKSRETRRQEEQMRGDEANRQIRVKSLRHGPYARVRETRYD